MSMTQPLAILFIATVIGCAAQRSAKQVVQPLPTTKAATTTSRPTINSVPMATSYPVTPPASRPASLPTIASSQPTTRPAGPRAPGPAPVIRCGQPGRKQVALTFDDGPSPRYTNPILEVLARHDTKATFFVLGRLARRFPKLLKKIEDAGHVIATHSWDHPKRASAAGWRDQMDRSQHALKTAGVRGSSYYRPPHGIITPTVRQICGERGLSIIMYTLLSSDWRRPGVRPLVRQVVGKTNDGGIVVLHDGGGNRQQTVDALPGIIAGLRKKGLQPVTLDVLLEKPGRRRCHSRTPAAETMAAPTAQR